MKRDIAVIMSISTYKLTGKFYKGGISIILSKKEESEIEGSHIAESFEKAIQIAEKFDPEEIVVIAGVGVYRKPDFTRVTSMNITRIRGDFGKKMKFFGRIPGRWKKIEPYEEKNPYDLIFEKYERTD